MPWIPPSVLSRWYLAVFLATAFTVVAMVVYPGGTQLDSTTYGYSLTQNFLSDLGTTVAFNGRSNTRGAICFVAGLATLLAGAVGLVNAVRSAHESHPRARAFARAALGVVVVVCIAFAGVALTPENRSMTWHVQFTVWAFRIVPLVTMLFCGAAIVDTRLPRRVAMVWLALTLVLAAYVIELHFAPSTSTQHGLTTQVVAQKLVVVSAVILLLLQSRMLARIARREQRHVDASARGVQVP